MGIERPQRTDETHTIDAIVSPFHHLFSHDIARSFGPNIGENGENLTITFLSLNRSSLSEKLLRSIDEHLPAFAGEILIIDNGSSRDELERLNAFRSTLRARSRLVELGSNFGVAGGRNRTVEHVATEWMMCLDNDIYFISNPIAQLQRDIGTTGAHFVSLPLLEPDRKRIFALGGHLYLAADSDGLVWLGAGSAYRQTETGLLDDAVFFGTFLFGGASVINVESFKRLGCYDDTMFIGFEDIDFSIRIFRAGMKVACFGVTALVHDHPPATSETDAEYERTRFSHQTIRCSAVRLEEKYGFHIWSNGIQEWLRERAGYLSGDCPPETPPTIAETKALRKKRLRIALVVDTDDWSFANIARQIERALGEKYSVCVIPHTYLEDFFSLSVLLLDYDFIHILWREILHVMDAPYTSSRSGRFSIDMSDILDGIFDRPVSIAVYDHLYLSSDDVAARVPMFSRVTGYTVSSNKLREIYEGIAEYPDPDMVFPDGVDLDLFRPRNLARFRSIGQRPIVIGWVGNSAWASGLGDPKGVNTILKPAIESLRAEGVNIVPKFADRQDRFMSYKDMPAYYASIDLLICTSEMEGTPNPVLEAMACGVPVISTDVGLVPEVFGELQRAFILEERSIACLKSAIRTFDRDRTLFASLSDENLNSIQPWDWKLIAARFDHFIERMMCKHATRQREQGRTAANVGAP